MAKTRDHPLRAFVQEVTATLLIGRPYRWLIGSFLAFASLSSSLSQPRLRAMFNPRPVDHHKSQQHDML